MKKKFSVEQILSVLKQAEVGVPIAKLIRKGRDQRADVLSLKVEVRRLGSGSGSTVEATAGREYSVEAVGS